MGALSRDRKNYKAESLQKTLKKGVKKGED